MARPVQRVQRQRGPVLLERQHEPAGVDGAGLDHPAARAAPRRQDEVLERRDSQTMKPAVGSPGPAFLLGISGRAGPERARGSAARGRSAGSSSTHAAEDRDRLLEPSGRRAAKCPGRRARRHRPACAATARRNITIASSNRCCLKSICRQQAHRLRRRRVGAQHRAILRRRLVETSFLRQRIGEQRPGQLDLVELAAAGSR